MFFRQEEKLKMNNLTRLFCQLVSIPSPSGKELAVGNFIKNYLKNINIEANYDSTGKINQSNAGNLIARLKGKKGLPTLLFVTHMDTVESGETAIKPVVIKNKIKSNGATILGADNKASVASLLEALKEISAWHNHPTIIAVFSTKEESGQMGISLLNIPEKIDFAFNIDGKGPVGSYVYKALGETPFKVEIIGKSAHAAIEPEKGVNAIKTAALIISQMKIGRSKEGNALNIGKIVGGKANNIVPDEVILEGQMRAFTEKNLAKGLVTIEKAISTVCKKTGCSYKFIANLEERTPPFSFSINHRIVKIAKDATKSLGLPFSLNKGYFTCEANFLAKKYPVLNICRGGKMPHSKEESITIKELNLLNTLIKQLVKQVSL